MLFLSLNGRYFNMQILHASNANIKRNLEKVAPHHHCVYHILLYHTGEGKLYLRDRTVIVPEGSLVLISPNEKHAFLGNGITEHQYAEVTFSLVDENGKECNQNFNSILFAFGSNLNALDSPIPLTKNVFATIHEKMTTMQKIGFSPSLNECTIACQSAQLTDLLSVISLQTIITAGRNEHKDAPTDSKISLICEYISQNFGKKISIGGIAKKFGWSREHLSRVFKSETGSSIKNHLMDIRMQNAEKLIIADTHSIKEIAGLSGVEDIYHFTKLFRKKFGLPPAKYRKKSRKQI